LSAQVSGDQWLVNIDALSTVAHVYCPDQPGWGLSSLPPDGYSFDMFVATIKGFCDALGLEQVDIAARAGAARGALRIILTARRSCWSATRA
jgi:pimeloyl-ACP methyl ester carboxylesterase